MSGSARASYVVLAYNNWAYTERCLESLVASAGDALGREIELVVVDNGSTDETGERLRAWEERARVVRLAPNRNFAGGINAGGNAATGEVLVLLNNDLEIAPGALETLVEQALEPEVGIVGTRLVYPDGRIQHGGFAWRDGDLLSTLHMFHFAPGDLPPARAVHELEVVTGACLALRRDVWQELGGFDEGFVNGWEDVDLCLRARAAGYRVVYRGDVHLLHHESVTAGQSWNTERNLALLRERWGERSIGDETRVRELFGGTLARAPWELRPLASADGTLVELCAPVGALGPAGDEARAWLELLEWMTLAPAVCDTLAVVPRAALGADQEARLAAAAARPPRHAPLRVCLGVAPPPALLRLAELPESLDARALVWTATPQLAEAIRAAHPRVRAEWLPSPLPPYPAGTGAGGILALLPAHEPALCEAVLRDLAAVGTGMRVRLLPTVADARLPRLLAASGLAAELLPPVATEQQFARLAADADVAVCLDPADAYQRRALVAAVVGATPVAAAGGQAEAVLGPLLATTLAEALASPRPRAPLTAAVTERCGGAALAGAVASALAVSLAAVA